MLHRFKTHKELRGFVRSPNALLLLKKHLLTKEEVDRAFLDFQNGKSGFEGAAQFIKAFQTSKHNMSRK